MSSPSAIILAIDFVSSEPTDLVNYTPPEFVPSALAAANDALPWQTLEAIAHADPGGRGLAGFRRDGAPLDAGQLRAAGLHLAEHGRRVAIVTGFCTVLEDRVTAETDGPPGALFLAQVLSLLGIEVSIVSDRCALPILQAGAVLVGLKSETVREFPFDSDRLLRTECDRWIDAFFDSARATPWTHLVAIERPGPSHTLESFTRQPREVAIPSETFLAAVGEQDRDACHTMLGEVIDAHTAPTHRLFEAVREHKLPIATIGIGDGGNELGMGSFLWEDLVAAIATGPAGRIACRVPADFALLAGTSNWGAYALALAVSGLRGLRLDSPWLTLKGQQDLLVELVAAGAVDGRTRRGEPTVDGLTAADYLRPLAEMLAVIRDSYRP
jgi:D-glutamate cyclase